MKEWTKKLGKTYGYFEGHTPVLVTSDLQIIQEVFFVQSDNFDGRKNPPLFYDDQAEDALLLVAAGHKWKKMRAVMRYHTFSFFFKD